MILNLILIALLLRPSAAITMDQVVKECSANTDSPMQPSFHSIKHDFKPVYDDDYLRNFPVAPSTGQLKCDEPISFMDVLKLYIIEYGYFGTSNCPCYFAYRKNFTLRALVQNSKEFECCIYHKEVRPAPPPNQNIETILDECSEHTGLPMKPDYYDVDRENTPVYDADYLPVNMKSKPTKSGLNCDERVNADQAVIIHLENFYNETDVDERKCECYYAFRPTMTLRSMIQNSQRFHCCMTKNSAIERYTSDDYIEDSFKEMGQQLLKVYEVAAKSLWESMDDNTKELAIKMLTITFDDIEAKYNYIYRKFKNFPENVFDRKPTE